MPKLWTETIDAHRRAVHDATLETTAALVGQHGVRSVTMSRIAEETGIGRATLYKYFPDVEAILVAWHERQVTRHLEQLTEVRDRATDPVERLRVVLEAYALISHGLAREHHGSELSALVHQGDRVAAAQQQLHHFVRDLIADAAAAGDVRQDIAPTELAGYCLHALAAAGALPTKVAVLRLVTVATDGLRPQN